MHAGCVDGFATEVGVRMPRSVWAIERRTGVVDGDEEFGQLRRG
jgi:hypothetical protein